jgi:hypothetical protein
VPSDATPSLAMAGVLLDGAPMNLNKAAAFAALRWAGPARRLIRINAPRPQTVPSLADCRREMWARRVEEIVEGRTGKVLDFRRA